jgi:hypothetical protein
MARCKMGHEVKHDAAGCSLSKSSTFLVFPMPHTTGRPLSPLLGLGIGQELGTASPVSVRRSHCLPLVLVCLCLGGLSLASGNRLQVHLMDTGGWKYLWGCVPFYTH